jgi:hypothetical protein
VSQRVSNFRSNGLEQSFGLVTERLDGLHEAPTVEEYDLGVLNTQAHSRGSASFR